MPATPFVNPLDNPIWFSLQTIHTDLAVMRGKVARNRPDHASFLWVETAAVEMTEACAVLTAPGDSVYLLGVAPAQSVGWQLKGLQPLAQIIARSAAHRSEVLALTARGCIRIISAN